MYSSPYGTPPHPVRASVPPPPMAPYSEYAGSEPVARPSAQPPPKTVWLASRGYEPQSFRVCAGERGDCIRAAVRGAFGFPDGAPFAVHDAAGCNVVLGHASVSDGVQYEVVAVQRRPGVTPEQPGALTSPRRYSGREAAAPRVSRRDSALHTHKELVASYRENRRHGRTFRVQRTSQQVVARRYQPGPLHGLYGPRRRVDNATKALFIGINYSGTSEQLTTCIETTRSVRNMLHECGFLAQERVLTDDTTDPHYKPTKASILAALEWLVSGSQAGDSLFLHYVGHGVEVREFANDVDQALLPVDFRASKPFQVILDGVIQSVLLQLAPGARLTFLCDCCYSGTLADLPFAIRCLKGDAGGSLEFVEKLDHPEFECDITMISSGRDAFTSADIAGESVLSNAFMQTFLADNNPTYERLLTDTRNTMVRSLGSGSHVPIVSSTRRIGPADRFSLVCADGHEAGA